MKSVELQRDLDRLWTTQDISDRWGVTEMAVHLWRDRGMPKVRIKGYARDAVRFVPEEVNAWTRAQGIVRRKVKKRAFRFRPALQAAA